jgi:hypothetical protein
MPVLTINQKIDAVNNFINSLKDSRNSYYCFVGKSDPYLDSNGMVNDTSIPPANNSISQIEQLIYHDMIYAKKLSDTDTIFMINRYNWESGTVYARYDNNDSDLYSKKFFVITDTRDVYKCINNGYSPTTPNGIPSTVKPTINKTSGNFQTSDGYVWKYMFTCDEANFLNFATQNYVPVIVNEIVKDFAVPGSIDTLTLINGGTNYQVYEEGFLKSYVNNSVVTLPTTSAPLDDYYTGSSIYLKSGFGSGQIRPIISYLGSNKQLAVNPPFSYYQNLKLKAGSINGGDTFAIGDYVSQLVSFTVYYYNTGIFNVGDTVYQSDSGAYGQILHANSVSFTIQNESEVEFDPLYAVYNSTDSAIKKSGKVTVNFSANTQRILAASGTNFSEDFAVNQYIRVGDVAANNIRRIIEVNTGSGYIAVNKAYVPDLLSPTKYTSANVYLVNSAYTIESLISHRTVGNILYKNLDSVALTYSSIQPVGSSFIIGETITCVDENNISQGISGTLSFANSTNLILSNVYGPGIFEAELFLLGSSSASKATIDAIDSYPNITVEIAYGAFSIPPSDPDPGKYLNGTKINVTTQSNIPVGNAVVVSSYSSPDDLTEYIISPTVTIEGDGGGALAYSEIDLSSQNPSKSITSIKLINFGNNYNQANVTITSNTLYGDGAFVTAQISPVKGHGADPYTELGATYCGINKIFEIADNENYNFPIYGSYRKIGIIKNPLYRDVIVYANNFQRSALSIENASGLFDVGEVLIQSSTNAAGVVVFANNSYVELKNVNGEFIYNTEDDNLYGLSSTSTSNCISANSIYFSTSGNLETISDTDKGGSGSINQTLQPSGGLQEIRMTNVVGTFKRNDVIYEAASNTYANVSSIFIANGAVDRTDTFGLRANQTARITLSSNTHAYDLYEYVTQENQGAYGRIVSTWDELDIVYDTDPAVDFVPGDIITCPETGANAVIIFANTEGKYLKLSAVSHTGFDEEVVRPFNVTNTIETFDTTKQTTINTVYSVLVLDDVNGTFVVSSDQIIGNTSSASGLATLENSIRAPEFIRETGEVIYLDNLAPFSKTKDSTEQVKLIIKF